MGADRRMYSGPWHSLPEAVFLDWPSYRGERTIPELAQRIISEQQIPQDSVLIGTSLGGIVACEIAKMIGVGSLILVGSARRREEISALLSKLHPLIDLTPIKFIQLGAGKVPNEILQMFYNSNPEFIRAMCKAVFAWEGLNDHRVKPFRIHGARDHVIPLPDDVQHVIDGGHLVAVTHAIECVSAVKNAISNI